MDKNTELSTQGKEISLEIEQNVSDSEENDSQKQDSASISAGDSIALTQNHQNAEPCVQKTGIEAKIESDFALFSRSYPNIPKDLLLSDEAFLTYASFASSEPLSRVYKDYLALCNQIELKVMHKLSTRASSVGALSDATGTNDGYFTKDEVKRMSPAEIKRNFEKIRQSQERW